MATLTICDGCSTPLKDSEATTVGRYDPCVFCADCLAVWRAHETAERAAHAQLVRDFEAWRANARRVLTEGEPSAPVARGFTGYDEGALPEAGHAPAIAPRGQLSAKGGK